ncbi:hypothetical protein ABXS69_02095 [Actinomyces timonensis]|uniref:Uncharacterized protein n=1 Tax=Actinomyces timonensis TaxID=1288391 RepID=A0AAU8N5R2_9ACTO
MEGSQDEASRGSAAAGLRLFIAVVESAGDGAADADALAGSGAVGAGA